MAALPGRSEGVGSVQTHKCAGFATRKRMARIPGGQSGRHHQLLRWRIETGIEIGRWIGSGGRI